MANPDTHTTSDSYGSSGTQFTHEFLIRHKSSCGDFKTLTRHLCTSLINAKPV